MFPEARKFFAKAAAFYVAQAGYYYDVISIIPSDKVKAALEEEGWKFQHTSSGNSITEAAVYPGSIGCSPPLEVVLTESYVNVYRSGDEATINRYEAAKKRLAAQLRGITP